MKRISSLLSKSSTERDSIEKGIQSTLNDNRELKRNSE